MHWVCDNLLIFLLTIKHVMLMFFIEISYKKETRWGKKICIKSALWICMLHNDVNTLQFMEVSKRITKKSFNLVFPGGQFKLCRREDTYQDYGSMGCRVFKRGIQNQISYARHYNPRFVFFFTPFLKAKNVS